MKMAMPTSLKMDPPTPTDAAIRRRFLWLYFVIIWISLLPLVILEYYFFSYFGTGLWMWILLPWNLFVAYYITVIWATYVVKFFLWWINLFHKPHEGVFQRSIKDKDYRSFHLRNLLRKFPLWLLYSGPFPWLKEGWMHRRFGAKIGENCAIHDAFLSLDFVELGDNVILGLGSVVLSYWYEQDRFILGRVSIGTNSIIGAKAVILPFTTIGEDAVVDAGSFILPGSEIEAGDFVIGIPAISAKMKDIPFSE